MNSFWFAMYLVGAYAALLFLPLGAIYYWRKRLADKRRSPLTQKLLRAPGETLRKELDEARDDMLMNMLMLPVLPLLIYALHISQSYFMGGKETVLRTAISVLFGVGSVAYLFFHILKQHKRANILRQGYEGEVAVAQELNQLMRDGAYVFHDVPADGFNIDHVIVGRKGVYAVETKSRMKPNRERGGEDANVFFDGQRLQFPGWSETKPLEQATRQARWLEQWLSNAVGEMVKVRPVLALPGWHIDRQASSDIVFTNGKNATSTFGKLFHASLSEEMTKRIAHQLEQRCRDVEPGNFRKRKELS
jgi:Nuclease-related domain